MTTTRRRTLWVGAVVGAAVLAVVVLVFEPQTLFIDTRVDDAFPAGAATTEPTATSEPAATSAATETPAADAAEPVALRTGTFGGRAHPTSGSATIYELADGSRVLRLEEFATDNGPDLFVYLSTAAADAPEGDFDDDTANLGVLAGNLGNQNYAIPDGVDVDRFASVVIWCDRFNVAFGVADLG